MVLATLPACGKSATASEDAPSADVGVADVGERPLSCGDNVTDPGEVCDGSDLNGFSTVDQLVAGYKSGALHCRFDCLGYDISDGVRGGTVNAASCDATVVQTALTGAAHGDTVMIPAGTCTWSTQVVLDATARSIALRGAGAAQTIINVDVETPLKIMTADGFTFGLSGIELVGAVGNSAVISIGGSAKSWRVHDLVAPGRSNGPALMAVGGATYGVVDHVTFTGASQTTFATVADTNWTSWQRPLSLGRATAVYFEDDTTAFTGQHDDVRVLDVHGGGRAVLRHSTITNFVLGAGGSSSATAGALQVEVYDNQIAITDPTHSWSQELWPSIGSIMGGTSVWFDNVFTVDSTIYLGNGIEVHPLRAASGFGSYWGTCDGTPRGVCSNVDKNWTTLSGAGAKPCVSDGDCGAGLTCAWKVCSVSRMQLCAVDGDCPATEACTSHLDGPSQTNGYPCFMQPGFATEMQAAPIHLSNNQFTGSSNHPDGLIPLTANSPQVVEGRDYITSPDPSYVPYVYPHPLVQLGP